MDCEIYFLIFTCTNGTVARPSETNWETLKEHFFNSACGTAVLTLPTPASQQGTLPDRQVQGIVRRHHRFYLLALPALDPYVYYQFFLSDVINWDSVYFHRYFLVAGFSFLPFFYYRFSRHI